MKKLIDLIQIDEGHIKAIYEEVYKENKIHCEEIALQVLQKAFEHNINEFQISLNSSSENYECEFNFFISRFGEMYLLRLYACSCGWYCIETDWEGFKRKILEAELIELVDKVELTNKLLKEKEKE